jgi:transposase-like protein
MAQRAAKDRVEANVADRDGNLIDAMLSEHRDVAAAKAFFRSAKATTGFGQTA